MTDYTIAPLEAPTWRIDLSQFAEALGRRWPAAKVGTAAPAGSTMPVEALLPAAVGEREVGITLNGSGQAVGVESTDPRVTAELALWVRDLVGPQSEPLHLIEDASMRLLPLTAETGIDTVVEWLQHSR